MRRLSDVEYWALTPPRKVIAVELIQLLVLRGLIFDFVQNDQWCFDLTPLGRLAVRVYEYSVDLEWQYLGREGQRT